ncbi:MAG TPA: DUF1295 domain-containing protein [Spirochaetia bacterium]|nr:DUF1295 domain-containing protein [Spirochaetia bacterium]
MNRIAAWILTPGNHILGSVPSAVAALLLVTLILSSIGFVRTVYFVGTGYALSVAGAAYFSFVLFRSSGSPGALLHMFLVVLYGFRLAGYLALRDRKGSYQRERHATDAIYGNQNLPVRLGIWLGVSLLYVAMASPVLFHFAGLYALSRATSNAGTGAGAVVVVGLVIGFVGLLFEWVADRQKASAKRRNPDSFCSGGVYRIVRYPNYLGDIVLWTGSFIAGVPYYDGIAQWMISAAGLAALVLIVVGAARRLEEKQEQRYSGNPAFRKYVDSVPILIPFVRLYTLKNLKSN